MVELTIGGWSGTRIHNGNRGGTGWAKEGIEGVKAVEGWTERADLSGVSFAPYAGKFIAPHHQQINICK